MAAPFARLLVIAISPVTVAPRLSLRASWAFWKLRRMSIGKPAAEAKPTLPRPVIVPRPARALNWVISSVELVNRPCTARLVRRVPSVSSTKGRWVARTIPVKLGLSSRPPKSAAIPTGPDNCWSAMPVKDQSTSAGPT